MKRDELIDGEWYLVKVKNTYLTLRMVNGDLQGGNKSQYGKTTIEHLIEDEGEWTKIKPECFFYTQTKTKFQLAEEALDQLSKDEYQQ